MAVMITAGKMKSLSAGLQITGKYGLKKVMLNISEKRWKRQKSGTKAMKVVMEKTAAGGGCGRPATIVMTPRM